MPDYDNMSMIEIYRLDATDRIKNLNKVLLKLEKQGGTDSSLIETAMREAHSLKAAARVINASEVQNVSHRMEDAIEFYRKAGKTIDSHLIDLFLECLDALNDLSDAFVEDKSHGIDVEGLLKRLESAKTGTTIKSRVKDADQEVIKLTKQVEPEKNKKKMRRRTDQDLSARPTAFSMARKTVVEKVMLAKDAGDTTIRVGIEKLEKMMNLSGEIYTNTLNLERENINSRRITDGFLNVVNKLQSVKSILESEGDIKEKLKDWLNTSNLLSSQFQESLARYTESFKSIGLSFGYLGTQLQDEVMSSRMLPISMIFDGQLRLVRDLARHSNKVIELEINGGDCQVDKRVLELIKDPLTHLVRNSCDHGIEVSTVRKKVKKKEEGKINLKAYHKADRVIIVVEDDGAGIDVEKLKKKIVEKKFVTEEKIDTITREEILNFVFLPGFSTAQQVTAISGRGVGLDVVKTNLTKIGGHIRIETEVGQFTRFVLSIPLTLAVTGSLLVEVGGEIFCFPMTRIEEVITIYANDIKTVEGKEAVNIRGEIVSLVHLAGLWELPSQQGEDRLDQDQMRNLVVIGQGREKVALWVDRFMGEKSVVSKSLDRRLQGLEDVSGCAILDDGQIAFIVDVEMLIRSSSDYTGSSLMTRQDEESKIQRLRVLVVEDSLTVRELLRKVLENNGYDVVVAVDGSDGWTKVQDSTFDIIVTDIEMPKMDGFELISLIKNDERLKEIPTIIVSYREREEDKRRGMKAGADMYITKSQYDDKILLDAIGRLIGK